jgi:hypothetical protein
MSKEVFNSLSKSLSEAGDILRGKIEPSRVFTYERSDAQPKPEKFLAVCIDTDDAELFIPGKIYEVKLLSTRYSVKDESGETVLCPTDAFLPLKFQAQVEKKIRAVI